MAAYQKVLVPLDGSKQSECALDHVRLLARACGVPKVVLLRVVEPFSPSAVSVLGDEQARKVQSESKRAAQEYLSYIATGLSQHCGGIEQVVVEGNAADAILEQANRLGVDLIAMSTHGESGIGRWAMGSVTGRVLQHSRVPVLAIAPEGCRP